MRLVKQSSASGYCEQYAYDKYERIASVTWDVEGTELNFAVEVELLPDNEACGTNGSEPCWFDSYDTAEYVKVWADWNEDGTFENDGNCGGKGNECVMTQSLPISSYIQQNGRVIMIFEYATDIPDGQTGDRQMRVSLSLDLPPDGPCSPLGWGDVWDEKIRLTHRFTGQVTDTNNNPVSGADIEIWSDSVGFRGRSVTDTSGQYEIGGLPSACDYTITVFAPPDSPYMNFRQNDISVENDIVRKITVLYRGNSTTKGHVYGSDGTPVAHVFVLAYSPTFGASGHTWTDEEGFYEITDMADASDYRMSVNPPSDQYASQRKTGIIAGDTVDFILQPGGSITGHVKDRDGAISEKAIAEISSEIAEIAICTDVNGAGYYSFSDLKARDQEGNLIDDYVVTIRSRNYLSQTKTCICVGDEVNFTLVTEPVINEISGMVRDSEGKTPPDWLSVVIVVCVKDKDFLKRLILADNGSFRITGLADTEKYQLEFNVYNTGLIQWAGENDIGVDERANAKAYDTGTSVNFRFGISWDEINHSPTAIILSSDNVDENRPCGAEVGAFSSTDEEGDDTHTYRLIWGLGDNDNDSFHIDGNILRTSAVFDYEAKYNYKIRIRSTDSKGGECEDQFVIRVNDASEADTRNFRVWMDKNYSGAYDPGEGVEGAHVSVLTSEENLSNVTAKGSEGIIRLPVDENDKIYAYKRFYSCMVQNKAQDSNFGDDRSANPYFASNETGGPDGIRYDFVMASDFLYDNGEYYDFPGMEEMLQGAQRDCDGNLLIQLVHPRFEWNLVVAIQNDKIEDILYENLKEFGLRDAANYIYDYTDGYVVIKNAVLVKDTYGTVYWNHCDVRIYNNSMTPNAGRYRSGYLNMHKIITYDYWSRIFGHEIGHYLLDFYDEYTNLTDQTIGPGPHQWIYRVEHPDEFPDNYGVMQSPHGTTEMSGIRDYFSHPVSDNGKYDPRQVTKQLYWNRESCWHYFRTEFQTKVKSEMSANEGFTEAFSDNLIIPPHEEGRYPLFDNGKREGPVAMNHNELNIIEWASPNPRRSAGKSGERVWAAVQIVDQAGVPISGAGVWQVSDGKKSFVGKTDEKGLSERFPIRPGERVDAYFQGRKAELHFTDDIRDAYVLTMPLDLANLPDDAPEIIVSAKPESSASDRIQVSVRGDSLTSAEATLHLGNDNISMTVSDSGWSGIAEYAYDSGLIELAAISETGSSHSVNPFRIQDIDTEFGATCFSWLYHFQLHILPDLTGSGKILTGKAVVVNSTAPHAPKDDLVQVGDVWTIGFSDDVGEIDKVSFEIHIERERLEGLDARYLNLYAWDEGDGKWHFIPGGGTDLEVFRLCYVSLNHISYALFAPRSSDTVPPDPVTDLQARTGSSRWAIDLQWTVPYDNEGVYIYEIRASETPFTETDWDRCFPLMPPGPAEPGTLQRHTFEMGDPATDYYFGIRSFDAAGNSSPISILTTPTKSHMYDNDEDGMKDTWETSNGLDPNRDDALDDNDGDGLTNILEYQHDTFPEASDTDRDGCSDTEEISLGSDPRDRASFPYSATIRVIDEAGNPLAGAEVWLVSDKGKIFQGRTDKNGLTESLIGVGRCLDAYVAGRKASLDIDGIWDEYVIVLPEDSQNDVPGIIVSVRPDDSYWSHVTVRISGDQPLSEPDVTLSQFYNYSHDISMASANDHFWAGSLQCKYHKGAIEIAAASESGSSLSASPFEIYYNSTSRYQCMNGELEVVLYQDGGKFMVTRSSVPAPPNGDLVQVGHVWGLGFSDHVGEDFEIGLDIKLYEEQLEGLAVTRMNLYGWNAESGTWELIPGGENHGLDFFETDVGFPKHIAYALFAPLSDDTIPPDPVDDFQVRTCDTPGCIVLRWTAPADNHSVYSYDIRYIRTVPLSESNWHECHTLASSTPLPGKPGTVQTATLELVAGRSYYFGIRSADASGNWSPITVPDAPTRTFISEADGDGMDDDWETRAGLDPSRDDSQNDDDEDGLTNIQEYDYSTNPKIADTDKDGWPDGDEVILGTAPDSRYSHPHLPGDLNCDAQVDLADAIIALQLQVSDAVPSPFCFKDADGDGKAGISESINILRNISGMN